MYSDNTDLLNVNSNSYYHPSTDGIVNIYVESTEQYGMKSSIINALTVFQLNVYCVSECESLSIYPPIRNISRIWGNTIFEFIYPPPFNYYNFQSTITQSKPETQIYAPFGIVNMNLTCSLLAGCKTALFCGIIDSFLCLIETNNNINECEIECMNRTHHLQVDINEPITNTKTGIIYVMPKGISQHINCCVVCVSIEKNTLINNNYYACVNSTINGETDSFIFQGDFVTLNSIGFNTYYLNDINDWVEFHYEDSCFSNSNVYISELNTLFIDIQSGGGGLNNIICANMILDETQTEIQFINIICGNFYIHLFIYLSRRY